MSGSKGRRDDMKNTMSLAALAGNCVIYLTPEMHRGTNGIHRNKAFRLRVQQEFQWRLEMAGWTRKEFIDTFLKSRL